MARKMMMSVADMVGNLIVTTILTILTRKENKDGLNMTATVELMTIIIGLARITIQMMMKIKGTENMARTEAGTEMMTGTKVIISHLTVNPATTSLPLDM